MMLDVIVTSEPIMKCHKKNDTYVTFNAVEKLTKSTYVIIVYNKHISKLSHLYLHKGDNVSLEGKLKSSDKLKQYFILKNIGAEFLQKIYS